MKLLTTRSKKHSLVRLGATMALVVGSSAYGSFVLAKSPQLQLASAQPQVLYASVTGSGNSCTSTEACSLSMALGDVVNSPSTTIYLTTSGDGAVSLPAPSGTYVQPNADYNGAFTVDVPSGDTVTIENYNGNSPVLNGDYATTVLNITGSGTLNLSGVTITGGNGGTGPTGGPGGSGGGISTTASLTVTNSTISGNAAGAGGTGPTGGAGGSGGGISTTASLTVTNSTISGNAAGAGGSGGPGGPGGSGGGISTTASLTVTNSTISGNAAGAGGTGPTGGAGGSGGGIFGSIQSGASLTVTNSTISGNLAGGGASGFTGGAAGSGGGIFGSIQSGGSLTVTNSTLSDNSAGTGGSGFGGHAGGSGGGIFGSIQSGGSFIVTNSTLLDNSAGTGGAGGDSTGGAGGSGGGISTTASLTVTNSTLSDNSAGTGGTGYSDGGSGGSGGGISTTASLTVTNSTIAGNTGGTGGAGGEGSSSADGGPGGSGGGISTTASLTVTNSTISGNAAGAGGTGVGTGANGNPGSGVEIYGSPESMVYFAADLLATPNGPPPSGGECAGGGAFHDDGYNVSDDSTCGFSSSAGDSSSAEDLFTLGSNGGSTETIIPEKTNPAIGLIPVGTQVSVNGVSLQLCPPSDQRGYVPTPDASTCDAGAYQTNYVQPEISFASPPPTVAQVGETYTLSAIATSNLPVSLLSSGCLINSSNVVTFTTLGTCKIVANQAGGVSGGYYFAPATQVVESITVDPAPTPVAPTPVAPIQPPTPHRPTPQIPPASSSTIPFGLITANGGIFTHDVPSLSSTIGTGVSDIVAGAPSGSNGYWLVTGSGTVESFGSAHSYGSVSNPDGKVVAMASTPDGQGYWIVTNAGTIYSFGDAMHFVGVSIYGITGLSGKHPLDAPVVGMAPTPDGKGLYLVAADGGIFNFGDAKFLGNTYTLGITGLTGKHPLDAPVVGMALTPSANGYLLFGADGGIFNFGDAKFLGNTYTLGITGLKGTRPLNAPIVGGTYIPGTNQGYYLFGADGGVFNFGTAPFEGSNANTHLGAPVVGMALF